MKKTLVFGASTNKERYSNLVANRLADAGHEVVAFGNKPGKINDITIDTELVPYNNIHTVTLYVRPQIQKQYYSYILSLKPKRVIFNPGTENPEFYQILQEKGVFVEVACTLVLLSTNQY